MICRGVLSRRVFQTNPRDHSTKLHQSVLRAQVNVIPFPTLQITRERRTWVGSHRQGWIRTTRIIVFWLRRESPHRFFAYRKVSPVCCRGNGKQLRPKRDASQRTSWRQSNQRMCLRRRAISKWVRCLKTRPNKKSRSCPCTSYRYRLGKKNSATHFRSCVKNTGNLRATLSKQHRVSKNLVGLMKVVIALLREHCILRYKAISKNNHTPWNYLSRIYAAKKITTWREHKLVNSKK